MITAYHKHHFRITVGAQAVQFTTRSLLQWECPGSAGPTDWHHPVSSTNIYPPSSLLIHAFQYYRSFNFSNSAPSLDANWTWRIQKHCALSWRRTRRTTRQPLNGTPADSKKSDRLLRSKPSLPILTSRWATVYTKWLFLLCGYARRPWYNLSVPWRRVIHNVGSRKLIP